MRNHDLTLAPLRTKSKEILSHANKFFDVIGWHRTADLQFAGSFAADNDLFSVIAIELTGHIAKGHVVENENTMAPRKLVCYPLLRSVLYGNGIRRSDRFIARTQNRCVLLTALGAGLDLGASLLQHHREATQIFANEELRSQIRHAMISGYHSKWMTGVVMDIEECLSLDQGC